MASANWRMFDELQTLKNLYMKKSCKNQSSSYTRISFRWRNTVPFPWSCAIWSLPSHLLHPIANTIWKPEPTFRHTEVSSHKTDTFKKCYWKMQMAPAPKSGGPNSVCFTKSCWTLMCQEWRRKTAAKALLFHCCLQSCWSSLIGKCLERTVHLHDGILHLDFLELHYSSSSSSISCIRGGVEFRWPRQSQSPFQITSRHRSSCTWQRARRRKRSTCSSSSISTRRR